MAGLQTKSPELFRSVELAQGLFLLVDDASEAQDHRPFDARDIDGEGFVEGQGAILVLIGSGDGGGLAGQHGLPAPVDAGAAAGGNDLVDGHGFRAGIGHDEGAGKRSVVHAHVPEVVDHGLEAHGSVFGRRQGNSRLLSSLRSGRHVICVPLSAGKDRGNGEKESKHGFHASKLVTVLFKIKYNAYICNLEKHNNKIHKKMARIINPDLCVSCGS